MNLTEVNRGIEKHKKRKRVGRGPGSGHGKTSGRGHKGQGQCSGYSMHVGFEGGQFPLFRRIPKRGFNNMWARTIASVNVGDLNEAFKDGEAVTPDAVQEKNLAKGRYEFLKILGEGELKRKLKISAHRFSASALEKIKAAGGEAIVLPGPKPVVKNKMKPKASKPSR
jgi:large subunit ribosomal protein L15